MRSKMVVATIPVTDLERSKKFYGGSLGLRLLHESPFSARFDAGGGTQLSVLEPGEDALFDLVQALPSACESSPEGFARICNDLQLIVDQQEGAAF